METKHWVRGSSESPALEDVETQGLQVTGSCYLSPLVTLLERAVFGSITPLFALKSNSDQIEWITSFYLLIYLNSICV